MFFFLKMGENTDILKLKSIIFILIQDKECIVLDSTQININDKNCFVYLGQDNQINQLQLQNNNNVLSPAKTITVTLRGNSILIYYR